MDRMAHVTKLIIMKALKIITHPYTLIVSFGLIMISGEHLGGFYALYLLLALYYGGIHSLLGLAGVVLLIVSRNVNTRSKHSGLPIILNIGGALFMILSLLVFFYRDKDGYNYGTFAQAVPLISLSLFSIIVLLFIAKNLRRSFGRKNISTKMSF